MNEETHCIINEGKTTKNEWENDEFAFLRALYSLYKNYDTCFSILTC